MFDRTESRASTDPYRHLHSDIAIPPVRTVLPTQSIVVIGSRAACVGLAFPVRDGKSWNLFVTEESYSYA